MDYLGKKFNLNTAEAAQLGLELLDADPTTNLSEGRIYYNTTDKVIRNYDGTEWVNVGSVELATATKIGGMKVAPVEGYMLTEPSSETIILVDKAPDKYVHGDSDPAWNANNKPTVLAIHSANDGFTIENAVVKNDSGTDDWVIVVVKEGYGEFCFMAPGGSVFKEQTEGAYWIRLEGRGLEISFYRKPDAIIDVDGHKYFWFGGVVAPQFSHGTADMHATTYEYEGVNGAYYAFYDDAGEVPIDTDANFEGFAPKGAANVQLTDDGVAYIKVPDVDAKIALATTDEIGGMKLFAETPNGFAYAYYNYAYSKTFLLVTSVAATENDAMSRLCWDSGSFDKNCIKTLADPFTGEEFDFEILPDMDGPDNSVYLSVSAKDGSFTDEGFMGSGGDSRYRTSGDIENIYAGFGHAWAECYEVYTLVPPTGSTQYTCPDGVERTVAFWNATDASPFFGRNANFCQRDDIDDPTYGRISIYQYMNGESSEANQFINASTMYVYKSLTKKGRVQLDNNGRAFVDIPAGGIEAATIDELGGMKLKKEEAKTISGYKTTFDGGASWVILDKPWGNEMGGDPIRWDINNKPTILAYKLDGSATDVYVTEKEIAGTNYWIIACPGDVGGTDYIPYYGPATLEEHTIQALPDGAVQLDAENRAFVDTHEFNKHKVFEFPTASDEWVVTHNLGYFPSVTLVDNENKLMLSDVTFNSENVLTVSFNEPQTGKVFLN